MFSLLWIPATIAASFFQVARNALQRGMMRAAGPWGATLVRFLFGLPFSIMFAAIAFWSTPHLAPSFGHAFWVAAAGGALSQVAATACLLIAMERAGFAVGTALQQSSLPLAALLGLIVYRDTMSGIAWAGVVITTASGTVVNAKAVVFRTGLPPHVASDSCTHAQFLGGGRARRGRRLERGGRGHRREGG